MAVKDTHKAFERLTDAGYSKEMAEALLETLSESWDSLAAKADIDAVRGDLKGMEAAAKADVDAVRGDLKGMEAAAKADVDAVRGDLKGMEAAAKGTLMPLGAI